MKDPRLDVYPIFIACEDKTRLLRTLNRETSPDCEEICRRFLTDLSDFEEIPFEYKTHYNGININPDWIIDDLSQSGLLTKTD